MQMNDWVMDDQRRTPADVANDHKVSSNGEEILP
jgi:hypothetical protein